MSTAEKELLKPEMERQREALWRRLTIPQPEEIYFHLPEGNPEKAIALLAQWCAEDDSDEPQAETWEYLKRVLDEDRLSPDRKLFS